MKYGKTCAHAFHAGNIFYYCYTLLLLVSFHSILGVILYKLNHSNTLSSTPPYRLLYIYCINLAACGLIPVFITFIADRLKLLLLLLLLLLLV